MRQGKSPWRVLVCLKQDFQDLQDEQDESTAWWTRVQIEIGGY